MRVERGWKGVVSRRGWEFSCKFYSSPSDSILFTPPPLCLSPDPLLSCKLSIDSFRGKLSTLLPDDELGLLFLRVEYSRVLSSRG